jgi:TRAP-type transport system small permease protein
VRLVLGLSDWADRLSRVLLVPIGGAFILVVFLGVVTRYVLQAPFVTTVELARLGFVWSAFLGAAICWKAEKHTQFLFLLDVVGPQAQRLMRVGIALLSSAFFVLLVVKGIEMVRAVQDTYFPALGWSQLWLYLPLPLCSAFMLLHALAFLSRDMRLMMMRQEGRS